MSRYTQSPTCDWCEEDAVDTLYEVRPATIRNKAIVTPAITASVCARHKLRFNEEKAEKEREKERRLQEKRAA